MNNFRIWTFGLVFGLLTVPAGAEELRSRMLIDDTMSQSRVLTIVDVAQDQFEQSGNEVSLNLQIQVGFDDTRLTPSSRAVLNRVATALLSSDRASVLAIEAHTDSKGSETYNLGLSKRRAEILFVN